VSRLHRRDFLRLAGSSAALAALPQCIRDALAIPANNRTGTIMDVEHVVILMQENRSFDHYFGTMAGVRGFGDRMTVPQADGRSVWAQRYVSDGSERVILPYHLDSSAGNAQRVDGTPHSWENAQPAWNNGRFGDWPTHKQPQSMGYYTRNEVDFQFALAEAFTVCDAYHCAFHGGTNTNRLFHWTGTNDPTGAGNGPAINNQWDSLDGSSEGYTWKTYPERLQQAGVRWKLYQNLPDNFTDNPLAGFQQYRQANEQAGNKADGSPYPAYRDADDADNPLYKGVANTMPRGNILNPDMLADFADDIRAGKLPQVSWVVAPATYSEHPGPSSPVQGAWYIQEVIKALTADPEVWSRTVLLVNFDENDGFFDHVPPPCAPSLNDDGSMAGKASVNTDSERYSGSAYHDGVFGPGPRVPMYVVSPWSRGGWVCSQTYDHTSVLRFLEARFGVAEPNISAWRRMVCGDLMQAFNFVNPNDETPPTLPERSKIEADGIRLSQGARTQVPVPDEDTQQLPRQATGVKPSRALPYELHATALAESRRVRLLFANSGDAGAVFHVYDRLHLDRNPRRYGVAAGEMIEDDWALDADAGRYDLWVLGPNGWHRHFRGDASQLDDRQTAQPEVRACYIPAAAALSLQLINRGAKACRFVISDNAYGSGGPWSYEVAAGATAEPMWSLGAQGNWYDLSIRLDGDDPSGFYRRCAGRLETGLPSVSDPAMGRGTAAD
jgi:phospholipase C